MENWFGIHNDRIHTRRLSNDFMNDQYYINLITERLY